MTRYAGVAGLAATAMLALVGAAAADQQAAASPPAQAVAVQIVLPSSTTTSFGVASAPPDATVTDGGFAYPPDGSVLVTGPATETASSDVTGTSASTAISGVSLFGGELTVASLTADVGATPGASAASGDLDGTVVNGLVVLGQQVAVTPGEQLPLADWGQATLLEEATGDGATPGSWRGSVVALDVYLDADHGGLPAGSRILVGFASAQAAPVPPATTAPPPTTAPAVTTAPATTSPPPATTAPTTTVPATTVPATTGPPPATTAPPSTTAPATTAPATTQANPRPGRPAPAKAKPAPPTRTRPASTTTRPSSRAPRSTTAPGPAQPRPDPATPVVRAKHPARKPKQHPARKSGGLKPPEPDRLSNGRPSPFVLPPLNLRPKLTAGGYVFPVYGQSAYSDTFGAPRADVSWHHGDDIFAPLGAPILAVADGTVFSVGWNDIGGNRLWLRDDAGNEFYYAHLSAYSTLARNGAHVHAGDVIGFVGDTGDAKGTPYHLHFEVHPVELLFLGYDGAVDPTPYLDAWKHVRDIELRPAVRGGGSPDERGLAVAPPSHAPTPGAILLGSSDISTASGLDPSSFQRALSQPQTSTTPSAPVVAVDLRRG